MIADDFAITPAASVRGALLFVARRETPLGIVYAADAAADPRVKNVGGGFPRTRTLLSSTAALIADSKNLDAAHFLLDSPAAKAVFEKEGLHGSRPRRWRLAPVYSPICNSAPRRRALWNETKKTEAPSPR